VYKQHGNHWKEGLFYTHLLGIPYFLFLLNDIGMHVELVNNSKPFVPLQDVVNVPTMWVYLAANVATQYPLYNMTAEC
jgi:UDP-xylose/UDP-N-acetylglucosamine transporter B4